MKTQRKNMNRFVMLRKNEGFTMIEMLFSLMILMTISLFVLQLFTIIQTQIGTKNKIHPKEWEIFTLQMQQEVRSSKSQDVVGNKLFLLSGEDLSMIEQYNDKLRRRVNGEGHEVILQNISNVEVEKNGDVIEIHITDKSGKNFIRKFHPFLKNQLVADE
ncbi:competence type IV pilus minor pilin ComGF [Peribacillus sp. NPDC097675]|uniref:competence type IV pilus minor pilin ComGF n=1 Tax=Peribacillus sp. NPDC097675 TaxID=3390618 RepID=UPI003D079B6A